MPTTTPITATNSTPTSTPATSTPATTTAPVTTSAPVTATSTPVTSAPATPVTSAPATTSPETTTALDNLTSYYESGVTDPNQLLNLLNTAASATGVTQPMTLSDVTTALGNMPSDSTYISSVNSNMSDQQDVYKSYQDEISSLQNGTFPLTPTQSAQINNINATFDQTMQSQMLSNQSYVGAITTSGIASGLERYAPTIYAGNIQGAISSGLSKIAAIDTQRVTALTNLQDAIEKENYTQISDEYTNYQKLLSDKQTEIDNLENTVYQHAKDQQTFAQTQLQDTIDNVVKSQTLTDTEKQNTIKNALDQSTLDEKTKADIASETTARMVAENGKYEVVTAADGTQQIFNKETGQFEGTPSGTVQNGTYTGTNSEGTQVSVGNTGIPLLDNNTTVSSSGIPYIDGTNLTAKESGIIQTDAANMGIPYLGKTQAAAVDTISKARTNIDDIKNDFVAFGATDATGRIIGAPGRVLSSVFQTNDQIATFNAWKAEAVGVLQGLTAGSTGARMSQQLVAQIIQNDLPTINDTVGVGQAKLAKLSAALDSAEAPIFGGTDKYNWMKSAGSATPLQTYASIDPKYGKAVAAAVTMFPNYTDEQIMQLLPGDVTNWSMQIQ